MPEATSNLSTSDFPSNPKTDPSHPPDSHNLDIVIVGAGFGGAYALYQYRKAGYNVKLYEGAEGYGGVWNRSRYPGARVDSELPYYQLSIPEVYNTFGWSERFPGHEELRSYFKHVGEVLDLNKDTCFHTVVEKTVFDEKKNKWTVYTKDGRETTCTYLVMATGASFRTHRPDFKGMDSYKGQVLHSADYPAGGLDPSPKQRVGIVGNGATGVQITQEMAKQDVQLTLFIRTPNLCLPMHQIRGQENLKESTKPSTPETFSKAKETTLGFIYPPPPESKFWDTPEEERIAILEKLWNQGGFAWQGAAWPDFIQDEKVNKWYYDFWCKRTRARISSTAKADIVAPLKQKSYVGAKRASLEQDYYEMIDRDNVSLVDLNASAIETFTEKGIRTEDGKEYELDTVILATGYNNLTGSMTSIDVIGTDGTTPKQKWEDGVSTYMGLFIPHTPNMFMIYSPQCPGALVNGPPCCELMVDWVADCIAKMKEEGKVRIECGDEIAKEWNESIQKVSEATLHSKSNSWYMGSNIPGKKREQLVYLEGLPKYKGTIYEALRDWKGLELS